MIQYDFHWLLQSHSAQLPLLFMLNGLLRISSLIITLLPENAISSFRNSLLSMSSATNSKFTFYSWLKYIFPHSSSTSDSVLFFSYPSPLSLLCLKWHINFCEYLIKFCLHLQNLKFMSNSCIAFCLLLSGIYQ